MGNIVFQMGSLAKVLKLNHKFSDEADSAGKNDGIIIDFVNESDVVYHDILNQPGIDKTVILDPCIN